MSYRVLLHRSGLIAGVAGMLLLATGGVLAVSWSENCKDFPKESCPINQDNCEATYDSVYQVRCKQLVGYPDAGCCPYGASRYRLSPKGEHGNCNQLAYCWVITGALNYGTALHCGTTIGNTAPDNTDISPGLCWGTMGGMPTPVDPNGGVQ